MFEWDPNKAISNQVKHRVDFADAVTVFDDIRAITLEDPSHEERRFISLGMDSQFRLLVVVYTYRNENIRIISARKATNQERKQYQDI